MNVNDIFEVSITVQDSDTAIAHKSGGLPVYATPAMIGLMENAAFMLLKNEGKDSVGTEMNVKQRMVVASASTSSGRPSAPFL